MSASSPEGILGSIVLVAIFWVAYLIATRKSTRNLSTSTAIPPTLPGGSNGKWYEQYGGYMWSVLLVIVGGGAVLWGMYHPVRLADAVQWREYWFPLLALWGFAAALVALNAKAFGAAAAKTLQWVLAGAMFILFIGLPVVNFFWGEKQAEKQVLPMSPGGKSQLVPVPQGMTVMMRGEDFRYHCVYGDGHEESYGKGEPRCPDGHMPFVYATNSRAKEANVVTYFYAYARK